jgi:hypothetical protein
VPEAFRQLPKAFRQASEAFRRVSEAFRRVSEAFRRVPEAFRRVPEALPTVSEAFWQRTERETANQHACRPMKTGLRAASARHASMHGTTHPIVGGTHWARREP